MRKGRCPDCTLAARRELRRGELRQRDQDDEASRVRRIEMSTPPASTFEGQLQRLRDTRAEQKAAGAGSSWWTSKSREELSSEAESRAHTMSNTREGRKVSSTPLP